MLQLVERRIEHILIAADVVAGVHRARPDSGHRSGRQRGGAAVNIAVLNGQFHRLVIDPQHVVEQNARLRFGKAHQRHALSCAGAAVDDQHRHRRVQRLIRIAQRMLCMDHSHHRQAGQIHAAPTASGDLPGEHRFPAVHFDFAVGEARAGVDVGGPSLNVVAGKAVCGNARGRRNQSSRAHKRSGAQNHPHPSNLPLS